MSKILKAVIERHDENNFWIENTIKGMTEEAARRFLSFKFLRETEGGVKNDVVYVVGTSEVFCDRAAREIESLGGIPLIVKGSAFNSGSTASVAFDIDDAVKRCLDYLKQNGKSNILFYGLNENTETDKFKKDAFIENARKTGVNGSIRFCNGTIHSEAENFVSGEFGRGLYDAILCANDTAALSLLYAGITEKAKVPEDLFLIGMGNSYIGKHCSVPLTTVDFDYKLLGKYAVKTGAFIKREKGFTCVKTLLPCPIIVRDSTANADFNAKSEIKEFTPIEDYFGGKATTEILSTETIMQTSDETDRMIMLMLAGENTYAAIAEKVSLTERAVSYRIDAIKKKLGFNRVEDLREFLKNIFYIR